MADHTSPDDISLTAAADAASKGEDETQLTRKVSSGVARKVLVIAVLFAAVVGIAIAIYMSQTVSKAPIKVPHTFSANVVVSHKEETADAPYTGTVYKTEDNDGTWHVSGQVVVSPKDATDDDFDTVYTVTNDRAYYQLVHRGTGDVDMAGCLATSNIPPLEDIADGVLDASVVPESDIKQGATNECTGEETYAIQWFGQTYLLCAHKDDRSFGMSGRAFDASLFNIDTTPNGNPIAPPKNVTGEPLDCPKLEVIQRVRDSAAGSSTTSRRLTTGGNVLPMEYWFLESSEEEEDSIALAVTHGRMLGDDDDDECCNCRRRRLLETAQEAHGVRSAARALATTYKGTLDRLMDENVLQGTSKTHDGHVAEAKHDFCICCTIPGIEHMNSWELPPFCTEDGGSVLTVTLDTSKPWDDEAEQQKLCAQLDNDGDGIVDKMEIYGFSTGNLMLAAAIENGHCVLDRDQEMIVWNMVEGILGREDVSKNPEEYCSSFDPQFGTSLATSRRLAAVGSTTTKFARNGATFSATGLDRMVSQLPQLLPGFSNQCTQTDSGYVPTPALMALKHDYSGLSTTVDMLSRQVDTVIEHRGLLGSTMIARASVELDTAGNEDCIGQLDARSTLVAAYERSTTHNPVVDHTVTDVIGTAMTTTSLATGASTDAYFGGISASSFLGPSGGRRLAAAAAAAAAAYNPYDYGTFGNARTSQETLDLAHTNNVYYI